MPVIRVTDLVKDYSRGDNVVHALRSVSVSVNRGEFVAVMGPSGSGKSTFMNLVGCLDQPSGGSYQLNGIEVASLSPSALADVRLSRLPVGSSARIRLGPLTKARAIATRCCWPPDIWWGRRSA